MELSAGKKKWHCLQKAGITYFKIAMNNSVRYLVICKYSMKRLLYQVHNSVQKRPMWESFCSIADGGIHMQLYLSNMSLKNARWLASLPEMQRAPGPCTWTASLSSRGNSPWVCEWLRNHQTERWFALLMPTNLPYAIFQEFLLLKRKNCLFIFLYQPRIPEKQSCFHNELSYKKILVTTQW